MMLNSRPLGLALLMGCVVSMLSPSREARAQSGFLKKQGSGYVKLGFDSLTSSDFFGTSGENLGLSGEFSQINIALYGEVGVFDFLTVGVSGPVVRLNSFDTSETATGLGDLSLFAKTGTEWAGFHGAFIAAVELPTGRPTAEVETDFEGIRTNLPTGDGETNVWLRLALSRSLPTLGWLKSYVSIHGGVNIRTEFSEQLATGIELGLSPLSWLWIQGRLDALFTPTATEDLDPRGIFLYGDGTEFVAAGVSASIQVFSTPLWVTVDLRNTFANLRNLYAGSTFGAGLAADW